MKCLDIEGAVVDRCHDSRTDRSLTDDNGFVGDVYIRTTNIDDRNTTTTGTLLVGQSTMKQLSIGPQFGGKIYSQIIFFETERDFNNFIAINNNVGTPGIDVPKGDDKPDAVTDNDDQVDKEMMVANSNSSNNKMYEFGADANIVALVASAGANVSTIGDETISARVIGSTTRNYEYCLNNALRSYNKGVAVFTTTLGGLMFETCLSGQEYKYKPSSSNKDDNDNDNHNSINEDDENNNVNNKENESSEGEKKDTSTKVFDDQQNASKTTSNTTSSPLSERVENIQKFAKSFSPFVGKGKTKSASSDNDEDDSSSKSKTSGNDENHRRPIRVTTRRRQQQEYQQQKP